MFVRLTTAVATICATLALTASAQPVNLATDYATHNTMIKRTHLINGFFPCGCNGFFPFAFNNVNAFNQNAFASNFNDNTVFQNHKNANVAADNVHAFNNVNVVG
ncbi:hypothetical protein J3B02_001218, partial [Coemansia erecta]|uniref:Uncharacterized protein n=1 Tax=Coemansia asiatica TaxID=1052880 RepID=A0A9W8CHA5_9FUNG